MPNKDFRAENGKSPVPFGGRGGITPERFVRFLGRSFQFAAFQLEPGILVSALRRKKDGTITSSSSKSEKRQQQAGYGQGTPFVVACTAVNDPPTGEPSSSRNIVSVLLLCWAAISPMNTFPNFGTT